jgi:hypothetical protein
MRKWGKWEDRGIGKFNCSSSQMAAGSRKILARKGV